jgi:primosomal protein N'
MEAIGIGSEGIEENLKENGFKVFVIDAKNTNTKTKIKKTIEDWQNEKLSVLVGTDLALNNLAGNHKIDFAGIISIDTLFSIPEINIDEKIMNLIIEFKEKCKTKSKLFIETRLKDAEIWKYIEENNYLGFLEQELENRKMLNLSPFSNILKFRLINKNVKYKDRIENLLLQIQKEENVREEKINWKKDNKTGDYIGIIIINKKDWEKENSKNEIVATNFTKKIHTLLSDFNLEINPQNVYK